MWAYRFIQKDSRLHVPRFKTFLYQRSTIILTTPHRLLAKPFIERLMPWCEFKTEVEVSHISGMVPISVMVFYTND